MLLNADSILQFLETRGFGEKQQVGYDLTLKEVKRVNGGHVYKESTHILEYETVLPFYTPTGRYIYTLTPDTYSITFEQGIKLDNNHTAMIRHRSSMLRNGTIITSGIYDPSFYVDEMGAVMLVTKPITIEKGSRVAQVIVFENHEAEAYSGQWNGAKDYK